MRMTVIHTAFGHFRLVGALLLFQGAIPSVAVIILTRGLACLRDLLRNSSRPNPLAMITSAWEIRFISPGVRS